jgi:hypothetical protein
MYTKRTRLVVSVGRAVRIRRFATLAALMVAVVFVGRGASAARAAGLSCAETTDPNIPTAPVAGQPCWTAVNPYPFVDPATDLALQVTSFDFRSWNRGLALVTPGNGATTAYALWRYNGTLWYPDPTFPGEGNGQGTCPGNTVLWAGKLDVWVIGGGTNVLCRFDGVNYDWEPLQVPGGSPITTGACYAWNNCWFFGPEGTVVHWDGQSLSDASTALGLAPWLEGNYTDAIAGTSADGQPFGIAITDPSGDQPGGAPAPQAFASTGSTFLPSPFSLGLPAGDPTNLAAVAFDAQGDGWVAGNPAALNLNNPFSGGSAVAPSPLIPISTAGADVSCASASPNGFTPTYFTYSDDGASNINSYAWTTLAVMPGGTAIAGGLEGSAAGYQPVLAQVSCGQAPVITEFQAVNPFTGMLGPADPQGYISAVAASANNDAWAATTGEFPQLYQFTDGQTPNAPAGNDDETRPVPTTTEPTVFEFAPPVTVPAPPAPATIYTQGKAKTKTVRLKAPIYAIGKPQVRAAGGSVYTLSITFRVRRKVRIALDALRGRRVISSSGIRTFSGRRGTLTVRLTRENWPTGLKFVLPKKQP